MLFFNSCTVYLYFYNLDTLFRIVLKEGLVYILNFFVKEPNFDHRINYGCFASVVFHSYPFLIHILHMFSNWATMEVVCDILQTPLNFSRYLVKWVIQILTQTPLNRWTASKSNLCLQVSAMRKWSTYWINCRFLHVYRHLKPLYCIVYFKITNKTSKVLSIILIGILTQNRLISYCWLTFKVTFLILKCHILVYGNIFTKISHLSMFKIFLNSQFLAVGNLVSLNAHGNLFENLINKYISILPTAISIHNFCENKSNWRITAGTGS